MKKILRRFKLAHRLMAPNLIFLLVLALAVYVAVYSTAVIQKAADHQKQLSGIQTELRNLQMVVQQFVSGELSHVEITKKLTGLQDNVKGVAGFDGTPLINLHKHLLEYEKLNQANDRLEKEILDLSAYAIQQSDGYINGVVKRLADEKARTQVSTLERLVIGGALNNTVSNYKIQLHLQQVKQHVQAKKQAFAYLNGLLEHIPRDIEKLAGTPFADLPKNAYAAARTIKQGFEALVVNLEHQNELKLVAHKDTSSSMAQIETITQNENDAIFHQFEQYFRIIALVLIVTVVIALALNFIISRRISQKLVQVITGIESGADEVASASGQLSSASQQLAAGSSEQAASIEETSASLEEMAAMTKQNADNSNAARTKMTEAKGVVDRVDRHMNDMAAAKDEISKSSEETGKIIKTIDEIAFQTNLLALNAAVEAARAGEAGAGFAVVADEVRNLAMRAAEAASSTSGLIENTIQSVQNGSDLTQSTRDAFKLNMEIAAKVGELVDELAAASNEQAQGIEQVNVAVTEMDKVVQSNAANAEESASASEEMSAQAQQMKAMVADLVSVVGGSRNKAEHNLSEPTASADQKDVKGKSAFGKVENTTPSVKLITEESSALAEF